MPHHCHWLGLGTRPEGSNCEVIAGNSHADVRKNDVVGAGVNTKNVVFWATVKSRVVPGISTDYYNNVAVSRQVCSSQEILRIIYWLVSRLLIELI